MTFIKKFLTHAAFASLGAAACSAHAAGIPIYVSPKGSQHNTGSETAPATLNIALNKVSNLLKQQGAPLGGVTVYLKGGHYQLAKNLTLGSEFKGSKESPIIIRNYPGEKVVLDGGRYISPTGFSNVSTHAERQKLAAAAADKILVKTIADPAMIRKLNSQVMLNLDVNGDVYLPSCFPNEGYAELNYEYDQPEVQPPSVPENVPKGMAHRAGKPPWNEKGKPMAWKGDLKNPRGAQVGFDKWTNKMAGSWQQWEQEINRNNARNILTGFVSADWLLESHPIYAASASHENIHLTQVMAYGWHGSKHKHKHFKVYGLLCELDQPGEWHFDNKTNRFYIYPVSPITRETKIGFPFADGFLTLKNTEYVSVEGLTIQGIGSGTMINIIGGQHNLVAGCTLRSSTARGITLSGTYNGVSGCDLVDLNYHIGISGGRRGPHEITPAYNFVENCHIYQVKFGHEKVNIGLSGVGNRFSNNLVHNSIGQAMLISGNDHIIEKNELFNIGYDEGDGGAMYAGADLAGYGVVYRYNFFHHLIHVPGKVARAGIHLDDHQAGAILYGNIFFKSAQKGIFMNTGAGNEVRENVLLEGDKGIYNVGAGSQLSFERQVAISKNPQHDLRNNKEDYVGRAEKIVGKQGWNHEPWLTKYPRFALVMNDAGANGRMWPIRNVIENNLFYGNKSGDKTIWDRISTEATEKSQIINDRAISPFDFIDYDHLDLRFKDRDGMPNIPFENIGLYLDAHRDHMPNKRHYRMAIKEFFRDVKSMPGTKKQINTGKVVEAGPKDTLN